MHYPDLTEYSYSTRYPGAKVLNVGWLDGDHDFPQGEEPGLAERLLPYAAHSIELTLGSDPCPLCGTPPPTVEWNNTTIQLGSSEIRVLIDDVWYASPTMIIHYIKQHKYRPPMDFIRGCFHGCDPTSQEYADALYELQRSAGPLRYSHAEITAALGSKTFGTQPPPEVAKKMKDFGF